MLTQHLLVETLRRRAPFIKVSTLRTKILVADNLSNADSVERQRRRKVVLQDIMSIKPSQKFCDDGSDITNSMWRTWKARHQFTSATWDFMYLLLSVEYFKKWLRNKRWHKHAKDLEKQFLEVLHMFTEFMKLKYQHLHAARGLKMRGLDFNAKALVTNSYHQLLITDFSLTQSGSAGCPRHLKIDSDRESERHRSVPRFL